MTSSNPNIHEDSSNDSPDDSSAWDLPRQATGKWPSGCRGVFAHLVGIQDARVACAPPWTGRPWSVGYFPEFASWHFGRRINQAPGAAPTVARSWLLHTCGHRCGQSGSRYGHSSVGRPVGQGRGSSAGPAVGSHLEHLVPGRARPRLQRRDARARGPQLRRGRAHPDQLSRAVDRRGPGPDRGSALDRAHGRHRAPRRRRRRPGTSALDAGRRRRRAHPSARGRHVEPLAQHPAESSLHVRPVRHRRLEPLRPRGGAERRRESRPVRTTRCSSTGRPGSAKPTCCTRSATTCASCSRASASATSRPRR